MKISIFIIFITILFSCNQKKQNLKLLKVTEYSSSKVSDSALVHILEENNNLNIEISYTLSEDYALNQLKEKKVDLVILPNNVSNNYGELRLLTPLLPRILIIYTNKKTKIDDLKELFEKGYIYFEERSRLDSLFYKKLFYNFNIDETKVRAKSLDKLDLKKQKSDSLLVYVGLTHLNNSLIKYLAEINWFFFSLDDVKNYGKGSKTEGFTMMNPSAHHFLIPMFVYSGQPEKPILTIALRDVLIANNELDAHIAYAIVETLVGKRANLIKKNNIYKLLEIDYTKEVWGFPLHEGAKNYLERNKPSVWMRWIRMMWPIISLLVVFIGAISSFRRIVRKKTKQNIGSYYISINEIKEKANSVKNAKDVSDLLIELNNIQSKAIDTLAKNKFDSSESFNLFLALSSEVKNDLNDKLKGNSKN